MNNSGAICNVNGTYLGHPCLYDKSGKYAFQRSEQKLLHGHFKGHLSVIWKSCQSLSRNSAGKMAQKIIFTLSPSLSPPLSFRSERLHWQWSDKWFTLENGLCLNWKRGFYSFSLSYSSLVYSCIKSAIVNVIWATANAIMFDIMGTRQATELKGDFDNSYLSTQSCVWEGRDAKWVVFNWVSVYKTFSHCL